MNTYQKFYKALLHMYPVAYRQEYETEMTQLFSELLADTTGSAERLVMFANTIRETIRWSLPEVTELAEVNVIVAPRFIKLNTILSTLCLFPFLCATIYRIHMLYDREAKPALLGLLIHTHSVYAVYLPIIGLTIAASTVIWSLVRSQKYWQQAWTIRLQTAWHNSLLIFCFISITALVILS